MIATEQEMDAARIDFRYRDYCVHRLLPYKQCKQLHTVREDWYCHRQRHAYIECQHEE